MAVETYMTEAEAREWVRNHGGNPSWYWNAQRGSHVLISDGVTTPGDMGVEIAAGRGDPAAVADYFVMAAQLLSVRATFAVGEARQRDSDEETFDSQADLAAAEAHQAATQAQLADLQTTAEDLRYTAEVERIATEQEHHEQMAELADRNAEVNRVYHLIFDDDHYATFCEGDGAREDNYNDQTWETAQALVDNGRTAASIKAGQQAAADASFVSQAHDHLRPDGRDSATSEGAVGPSYLHAVAAVTGDPAAYTADAEDAFLSSEPVAAGYASATAHQLEHFHEQDTPKFDPDDGASPGTRRCAQAVVAADHAKLDTEAAAEDAADVAAATSADDVLAELTADLDATAPDRTTSASSYPGDVAARTSADEVLAKLTADLDATAPDPYPGDNSAYWDSAYWDGHGNRVTAALQPTPSDIDGAVGALLPAAVSRAAPEVPELWTEAELRAAGQRMRDALADPVAAATSELAQGSGEELPELPAQEYSVTDDGTDFEYWADQAAGRNTPEFDPDEGAPPGKPRCAQAVAAAHDAVRADAHCLTDQLAHQQPARLAADSQHDTAAQRSTIDNGADRADRGDGGE